VVLVGVAGSGKSTWARRWFPAPAVVSSDQLRGIVGRHERDQRASKDAFEVLELIVRKRLRRRLTTVVDSTSLEAPRRAKLVALAAGAGLPCCAVAFDVPERQARAQNRAREHPVPSKILTEQLAMYEVSRAALDREGFAAVAVVDSADTAVELVAHRFLHAPALAVRQKEDPMPLTFGLQIGGFPFGGSETLAPRLAAFARTAEDVGFTSITLMDHLVQIPQIGPEWQDMPESWTTLAYLAGATRTARLGALVSFVGLRNIAHLGKIVATLDVLSGGRAWCGLGAGWYEREQVLYGIEREPVARRLDRVEDALQLLPLLWGPGSPPFTGKTISTPAATCYPRPIQERIPIVVGGGGERRTLRLVAEFADATNLMGEPEEVAAKLGVLHRHCEDVGRDPAEIQVTHLSEAAVLGGRGGATERYADVVGTVEEQIGRYRALAEVGVEHAVIGLHNDGDTASVEAFGPVIDAFR
jgi:F420-dependent oxidoreductase-like protein